MDQERFDRWLELGILALLMAMLTYASAAIGAVKPLDFLVVQGLAGGMVLLWIIRVLVKSPFRMLWTPVGWAVLAFTGYAAVRYGFADIEYAARQELLQILVYALVFFTVLANLHHRESAWWLSAAMITLGTLISLYAIYQFMTGSEKILLAFKPKQYLGRASGTFVCPNHLASFLEMLIPLALAQAMIGRRGHATRLLLGYGALVMVAGLAVTISRSGWIAGGLSIATLLIILLRQRRFWLPAALLAVALIWGGAHFYSQSRTAQQRLAAAKEMGHDRDPRFHYWRAAYDIWRDHPWWGAGGNHYDHLYRAYRVSDNITQTKPGWAHNEYLNTLADYGLAGLLLALTAIGTLTWSVFHCWPHIQRNQDDFKYRGSNKTAQVLGLAIGLLGLCVHAIFDFNLHIPAIALLAVTWMALLASYHRYTSEDCWASLRGVMKWATVAVLTGLLALLGWQGSRKLQETKLLDQARRGTQNMGQLAAWKSAFEMEPMNPDTAYAVGEGLRQLSWEGNDNYRQLATEALPWFERAMRLNPHDPYAPLRYGMCLHWLKRHAEARPWFERALKLDPGSYYMLAHMGWHHAQLENWDEAKKWFDQSLKINWWNNPISYSYLKIISERKAAPRKP